MVVFIFLNSVHITYALEEENTGEGQVVIAVNFTDENRYNLSVIVHEGGRVVDGKQKIQQGTIDYSLGLDTQKEFKIIANEGYTVEKVTYQRPYFNEVKDITNELAENVIKLDIESTDMVLEVSFKEKTSTLPPEEKPDTPDQPDVPSNPDKPTDPGQPSDPSKPTDPGQPSDPNKPDDWRQPTISDGAGEEETSHASKVPSNVGTGDKSMVYIVTNIFLLSMSVIVVYLIACKKKGDKAYKE